jgi:hypothetical protein
MGWARFDDNYSTHPKVRDLSVAAELLDMRAIIAAARHDTDGVISRPTLKTISHQITRLHQRVDELVAAGRWATHPDGWVVHDFLKYNPSKAQREAQREAGRERVRKHREERAGNGVTNAYHSRGGEGIQKKQRVVERCARCNELVGIDCECENPLTVVDGAL